MVFKGIASNYSKLAGIYKIVNSINNKEYIGATKNLSNRLFAHRRLLKKGIHSNKHLQSSYNKYGKESFEFKIIKIVYCSEIVFLLVKKLIKKLNCVKSKNYYNFTEGGLGGTTSTKEKRSAQMKALWADPNSKFNTKEYKDKLHKIRNRKEYKEILSKNQKDQWTNPDSVFNTTHYRNKLKQNSIFSNKEFQEKSLNRLKDYWSKKESKLKHSKLMKEKWKDPNFKCNTKEFKQNISNIKKEQWAKNKEKFTKAMKRKTILVFDKGTTILLYEFKGRKAFGEFFNYSYTHVTCVIKGRRKPKKFSKYIIIYKDDLLNHPKLKLNKI